MTATETTTPLWTQVADREVRMRLHSVMFWASTGIMVILIVVGAVLLHALSGHKTTYDVGVSSARGQDIVTRAAEAQTADRIVAHRYPDAGAATAGLHSGAVDAVLAPAAGGGWTLTGTHSPSGTLTADLAPAVQADAITVNAQRLGVSPAEVVGGGSLRTVALHGSSDSSDYRYGLSFAFGLLFFMSCQMFGASTASSVVEEKESRVVEVLLAAIPVRALLLGKVVGNVVVGIGQMALFAVAALVAATAVGDVPHLAGILSSGGWFLLFYLIGFTTVCGLFAGLGALASRTQELQAATAPMQLLVTATYLIAVVGKGAVVTAASFVPVASTVTMPARLFEGDAPWWQVAVSLALSVLFGVGGIALASRLYRRSVLHSGGRLRLGAALRSSRSSRAALT